MQKFFRCGSEIKKLISARRSPAMQAQRLQTGLCPCSINAIMMLNKWKRSYDSGHTHKCTGMNVR